MPTPRQRLIPYPTGRLLGVIDRPDDVPAVVADLERIGIPADDVVVLDRPEAIERLAGGGPRRVLDRLIRAVQFTTMDQLPDLILYEAALRDGRAVIAVRAASDERKGAAIEVLRDHGAHFLNAFARFSTEEISLWRGEEPDIPGLLRR